MPTFSESNYVPSLEPEWIEGLKYERLRGLDALVLNEDFVVIDATEATARHLDIPLRDLIGMRLQDVETVLPWEERQPRLQRVFDTGEGNVVDLILDLPTLGPTRALIVTHRVEHPVLDKRWLLQLAFNINDLDLSIAWLGEQAVQNTHIIIADDNKKCLAATDAAARFCGYPNRRALIGKAVQDTPYHDLAEREALRVAHSRESGVPACDLEWLDGPDGVRSQWSVTRIGFDGGGKMLIFCQVSKQVFFQGDEKAARAELVKAGGPELDELEWGVLIDWYNHFSPEQSAARRSKSEKTIGRKRTKIREDFNLPGVEDARMLLSALKGTAMERPIRAYARIDDPL